MMIIERARITVISEERDLFFMFLDSLLFRGFKRKARINAERTAIANGFIM